MGWLLSYSIDNRGRHDARMPSTAGVCPARMSPAASAAQKPLATPATGRASCVQVSSSPVNRVAPCLTAAFRTQADRAPACPGGQPSGCSGTLEATEPTFAAVPRPVGLGAAESGAAADTTNMPVMEARGGRRQAGRRTASAAVEASSACVYRVGRPVRPRSLVPGSRSRAVRPCRPRERDGSRGHLATERVSIACRWVAVDAPQRP
mgnify:CR=1 FL=1